jgi:hypothetical protein
MNEYCTYKTFPELCEEVTVVGISACTDTYSIHGPKSNIQCTMLLLSMLVLEEKIWMNQIPSPDLFSIRRGKAAHHLDVCVVLIML